MLNHAEPRMGCESLQKTGRVGLRPETRFYNSLLNEPRGYRCRSIWIATIFGM